MDNGAGSYRRYLDGDDSGLVELICEYRDGLMLFLNGILNDLSVAEELTEETFVRLALRRPRFAGRSSFQTWLYTIGRNLAMDHLRRRKKLVAMEQADLETLACDEASLETAYLREERRIQVHRALRKLSPEYRQVLWLVWFEDFDNERTAKIMKKNKRQIENLLYRAKQSLKTELEKEGFIYEEL